MHLHIITTRTNNSAPELVFHVHKDGEIEVDTVQSGSTHSDYFHNIIIEIALKKGSTRAEIRHFYSTHKELFATLIESMSEIYWDGNNNVRDYDIGTIFDIHEAINKYWNDI